MISNDGSRRPSVKGLIETGIFVSDPRASEAFYERVLGLRRLGCDGERLIAMSVADNHVLLLFKKGASREPTVFHGGTIPPQDADGQTHFAFAADSSSFEAWLEWLKSQGIEIESVVHWDRGGRSIYFRDPDGHNVELATPGIWDIY